MIKEPKVFPMMKHTELINYVSEAIHAKVYLEIGVYNPEHNFDRICTPEKLSVDPDPSAKADFQMTSDMFFKTASRDPQFDLIFIDGLHHADQVRKDIINSWACLNEGGCIILHDTNPHSEHITCVPRGSQREWCGNVYQAVVQVANKKYTLNDDYGVTIIRKNGPLNLTDITLTWEEFDMFRDELLNLKNWDEMTKTIDSWNN